VSEAGAREIVTPEGVPLRFTLARVGDQLGAFMIDGTLIVFASILLVVACIALAVVTLRMLKVEVFGKPSADERPPSSRARILALTSLAGWLGAIVSGRLLAYVS